MIFKVPSGSPVNKFAFNNKFLTKSSAIELIQDAHKHWKSLIKKELNEHEEKDAKYFKLFNTQCSNSFIDYKKNDCKASLMVENFKKLILDRPTEAIINKSNSIKIDEVYYLEKDKLYEDYDKNVNFDKIERKDVDAQNDNWYNYLNEQKYVLIFLILGGCCAINFLYKRE